MQNLLSYTFSNPVVTQRSDSFDGGAASRSSTSGAFSTLTISIVNGAITGTFAGVDQSQQAVTMTGAPPAAVTTALLAWAETLGAAKLAALIAAGNAPAGTTATLTAGP